METINLYYFAVSYKFLRRMGFSMAYVPITPSLPIF